MNYDGPFYPEMYPDPYGHGSRPVKPAEEPEWDEDNPDCKKASKPVKARI